MKKALANAMLLCGYIIDYNEKNEKNEEERTQLDFFVKYNCTIGGVEVLVNRLWEISSEDVDMVVNANDILKGHLKITKTGEISVTFKP